MPRMLRLPRQSAQGHIWAIFGPYSGRIPGPFPAMRWSGTLCAVSVSGTMERSRERACRRECAMSHLIPSSQQSSALDRILAASDLPLSGQPPHAPSDPEPLSSPALDVEAAQRGERLRILILAAESTPYVKSGGVADVIGSLARALRRMGHDVRVALPRYGLIDPTRWDLRAVVEDMRVPVGDGETRVNALEATQPDGAQVYFIDAPAYFDRENGTIGYPDDGERFILFNRAALELTRAIGWAPDVIHCHDWYASITPNWLKTNYRDDPTLKSAASVLTIHNLQYHGIFGYRILEVAGIEQKPYLQPEGSQRDAVDLLGRGIEYADLVSTVSPRYAAEILTAEYGEGLHNLLRARKDRLYGILNGIDTEQFDPATDHVIESPYDAFSIERRAANKRALQRRYSLPVDERAPLIAIISRFNQAKGFELLDLTFTPILEQGRADRRPGGWGTALREDDAAALRALSAPVQLPEDVQRRAEPAHPGWRRHAPDAFTRRAVRRDADAGHALRLHSDCPACRRPGGYRARVRPYRRRWQRNWQRLLLHLLEPIPPLRRRHARA